MHEEPSTQIADTKELLLGELGFCRAALLSKLRGLSAHQLTTSILPSGWTPLGLLNHLVHVERRWIQWGFEGVPLSDPWADHAEGGGWRTPDGDDAVALLETLAQSLDEIARHTDRVADEAYLDTRSRNDGRFTAEDEPPTLGWILVHLVQEYSRHVGHLDIVRELLDGTVGE
jgi:uncharacterized damage-inducible protein DinB